MSIAANQVVLEYNPPFAHGAQLAFYLAMLVGALFWGITADIVGRWWAFNFSLFISAVFAIAAGGAPNYIGWSSLVAISAFGSGGNLVLDTTVFLEYLPSNKQWLLTLMAGWWGVGQFVAGVVAWGFMRTYRFPSTSSQLNYSVANFSCPSDDSVPCTKANNMGWRYLFYTCGALVFCMSVARVAVIRFLETPKYLLCQNQDEKVVQTFKTLAQKYNRPCHLTVQQLQTLGQVRTAHAKRSSSVSELLVHLRGLFATSRLGVSTSLVWFTWALIGLGYALYYVFLPTYLATHGAASGNSSYITWRNYAITNLMSIPGPIVAGFLSETRLLGRKYTMALGAILTSEFPCTTFGCSSANSWQVVFFFAYTGVSTDAENLGFNCAISLTYNFFYGTLYAYTVEVMPSAHRGTGNGIAVAFNRLMGIMSAVVGTYAPLTSSIPIYICAAMVGTAGLVVLIFPFETRGKSNM